MRFFTNAQYYQSRNTRSILVSLLSLRVMRAHVSAPFIRLPHIKVRDVYGPSSVAP